MPASNVWAEPPESKSELDELRERFAEEVEENRRLRKRNAALKSANLAVSSELKVARFELASVIREQAAGLLMAARAVRTEARSILSSK